MERTVSPPQSRCRIPTKRKQHQQRQTTLHPGKYIPSRVMKKKSAVRSLVGSKSEPKYIVNSQDILFSDGSDCDAGLS